MAVVFSWLVHMVQVCMSFASDREDAISMALTATHRYGLNTALVKRFDAANCAV